MSFKRNVSQLGYVILPKEYLKKLNIKAGDEVLVYQDGDRIVVEKHISDRKCKLCGEFVHGDGERDIEGNLYHTDCYKKKLLFL